MKTDKDTYFMDLAFRAAQQSHCMRRKVGALVVDHSFNIKALTYNGPARGRPHCDEGHACYGLDLPPGQDRCEGLHAEQSAMLACGNDPTAFAIYVTEAPCFACTKFLLHTRILHIIVPGWANTQPESLALWQSAGKIWSTLDDYQYPKI